EYPPLRTSGLKDGESLKGIEYAMPVPSAQVKTALLLSGLYAKGITALSEPTVSRDHTERMLRALGVSVETAASMVVLDPTELRDGWEGYRWEIPGDFSSAAFLLAAAHLVPGSELVIEGLGSNPTRTGFLDALRLMGSPCEVVPKGDVECGEPIAELH